MFFFYSNFFLKNKEEELLTSIIQFFFLISLEFLPVRFFSLKVSLDWKERKRTRGVWYWCSLRLDWVWTQWVSFTFIYFFHLISYIYHSIKKKIMSSTLAARKPVGSASSSSSAREKQAEERQKEVNVQVVVRCRPFNNKEKTESNTSASVVRCLPKKVHLISSHHH